MILAAVHRLPMRVLAIFLTAFLCRFAGGADPRTSDTGPEWMDMFDGRSLQGWQTPGDASSWRVQDGCLVGEGAVSPLLFEGSPANHAFHNFELAAEVKTEAAADSGICFHTTFDATGGKRGGYEVQISNSPESGSGERSCTGSLHGVRNIYRSFVRDGQWSRIRLLVVDNRIRIWVNDDPTVDYLRPAQAASDRDRGPRVPSGGKFALQGGGSHSRVAFRSLRVRRIADDADALADARPSDAGYGVRGNVMDRLAARNIPLIDYHIHMRGGMTVDKAIQRQAVTGINCGVLRNIGAGWPIETDGQLEEFLRAAANRPVFVGLQVNDRDWMDRHSPELLRRVDYVLADTMIMPMPTDQDRPVKLWLADQYTIDDPQAWMQRYLRHNLRVLAEPISILANPTYLPPPVEQLYDELWTDDRMRRVIQAAIDNHVALEINARSPWPHERFIRMAKQMGATFSFGSNNFDDRPIDMTRCLEAVERYGLTKNDLFVPLPKE